MKTLRSALFFLLLYSLLMVPGYSPAQKPDKHALKSITPALMKEYIGFLASDALAGRNTPSPGLDTAAAFIARTFRANNVAPLNGNYFQPFYLCKTDLDTGCYLQIVKEGKISDIPLKTGFIPYYLSNSKVFTGEAVFAGYGITAPEYQYDDYAGLDVKNKAVLVFRHEPCDNDSGSFFEGREPTRYSGVIYKQETAEKQGAGALLVVSEPGAYPSLKPRGYIWPSLSKNFPADAAPYTLCDNENKDIPAIQIGAEAIKSIFGSIDSLRSLQTRIDKSRSPHPLQLPGVEIRLKINARNDQRQVVNVVGYLEGSDPVLKNEIVVIGAHYDHVGINDLKKTGEDNIFNGADDNASGTSGVMALARAFAMSKNKPRRSMLFLLFAGEEKGLYGSAVYTAHPLLPLEKTVAMLNLDMIGRNSPKTLYLVGASTSPNIAAITKKENRKTGFKLIDDNSVMGGSDHYNFFEKDIPFMFYFTGLHKDYHQVGDNPDKINYEKAARVTRLVYLTAWHIANESRHYKLNTSKN